MNDLPTIMNEDGGKRAMGREEAALAAIDAVIANELQKNPPRGVYDPANCTFNVVQEFALEDPLHCQAFGFFQFIKGRVTRQLEQNIKASAKSDARDGVLARKEYALVKPWMKVEGVTTPIRKITLEQGRESVADHAARIKRAGYSRWSEEHVKREKAALAQERKLIRKVAPFMAGDEQMEFGFGLDQLEAKLESPVVVKARKAIKVRWDKEKART